MSLLSDWMPDLPEWLAENAPYRTKKVFDTYLAARALTEIPKEWASSRSVSSEPVEAPEDDSTELITRSPVPQVLPTANPVEAQRLKDELLDESAKTPAFESGAATPANIFIVHGHDEAARDSVRIAVHDLTGIVPTSLAEKPGRGDTIIEKFEKIGGEASYVIVLLTPDDVGQTSAEHDAGSPPTPRARQNVVLELGYFIGKIGRANVVVLDADVERPSDLAGLSYVKYPGLNWKDELRKELKEAGLTL